MKCLVQANLNLILRKSVGSFLVLVCLFAFSLTLEAEANPRTLSSSSSIKRSKRIKHSVRRIRKVSRRKKVSTQKRAMISRRGFRNNGYRRSRTRRVTTVRHRPYYPNRSTRSSDSGFLNQTILEVGGQIFSPLHGEVNSGMHIGIGSRLGPLAALVEAQFSQGELGAELKDLNAQLRIYLPISPNVELFPMVAVGHSYSGDEGRPHLDLGIGAQLNLNDHFAIGGRYSARMIAEENNGLPTNGHNLLAQASIRF